MSWQPLRGPVPRDDPSTQLNKGAVNMNNIIYIVGLVVVVVAVLGFFGMR
jgi:hypothetical protein